MAPCNTETEKPQENQTEILPSEDKRLSQGESEKDSGFSDSSSEGQSSEELSVSSESHILDTTPAKPSYTPIFILQNVVVKQSRLLLLQPPIRRHRKRPSSYLPILRSYPKIAPRIDPPAPPTPNHSPDPSPLPATQNRPSPALLDISLRSIALMHRNRETQRSIRELRGHIKLYNRAQRGEEGGWERLRRAMERSGVYRGCPKSPKQDVLMLEPPETSPETDNSMLEITETFLQDETSTEEALMSPDTDEMSSNTAIISSPKSVMSSESAMQSDGEEMTPS